MIEEAQVQLRRDASHISVRKQVLFSIILIISVLLCLEITTRVISFLAFDRSPFFLFYGIEAFMGDENRGGHSVAGNGYFKFEANRTLHQYGLFKEPTPIRINNIGVRGQDFNPSKLSGTLRIICLGESSTFGFYSRDSYTYPAVLEKLLKERHGSKYRDIEVINAGIPHANSDNVRAFLKEELLSYSPDIITVYAGFNDASYVMDPSILHKFLRWMHGHVTIYVAMKKIVAALGGPELYSKWAKYGSAPTAQYVERQIQLHVERYRDNLKNIIFLGKQADSKVVLIKQGTARINNEKRDEKSSLTYEQEAKKTNDKLLNGQTLSADDITLLIHSALMNTLAEVAAEQHVPAVDFIGVLDKHPEYFASYVHLTEDGNAALAKEIADQISLEMSSMH